MRISVAACELPHPEGTAAGRDLWSWCEGLRQLGHAVDAWVWYRSASSPEGPVPDWCRYEPLDPGSTWRSHLRALWRPRQDARRGGWQPEPGAVAVADHLWSFAAVARFPRRVATFHFRSIQDAVAVRRVAPATIQMARAEQYAGRRADVVLAYSQRLGRGLRRPVRVVPIGYPVPPELPEPVDAPVAALLADWSWPPNRLALRWLLEAWSEVRAAVPTARLLLAGRHLERAGVGTMAGVEQLGQVAHSADVLGRAAVVAFPCPRSSGPKVKVIEALAHGVAVVTTPAGMEGVSGYALGRAGVSDVPRYAGALARVLAAPEEAAALGAAGRTAVLEHHSPLATARARLAAFSETFGEDPP